MRHIVCDIEADGPVPPLYSMISFGAVLHEDPTQTFYAELRPISDQWIPDALAVSGFSREQTMAFASAQQAMTDFYTWNKHTCGDTNRDSCLTQPRLTLRT